MKNIHIILLEVARKGGFLTDTKNINSKNNIKVSISVQEFYEK